MQKGPPLIQSLKPLLRNDPRHIRVGQDEVVVFEGPGGGECRVGEELLAGGDIAGMEI